MAVIGTEGPLGPKIVRFPPKSLAPARSHPSIMTRRGAPSCSMRASWRSEFFLPLVRLVGGDLGGDVTVS